MLHETGLLGAKPTNSPLETGVKLEPNQGQLLEDQVILPRLTHHSAREPNDSGSSIFLFATTIPAFSPPCSNHCRNWRHHLPRKHPESWNFLNSRIFLATSEANFTLSSHLTISSTTASVWHLMLEVSVPLHLTPTAPSAILSNVALAARNILLAGRFVFLQTRGFWWLIKVSGGWKLQSKYKTATKRPSYLIPSSLKFHTQSKWALCYGAAQTLY